MAPYIADLGEAVDAVASLGIVSKSPKSPEEILSSLSVHEKVFLLSGSGFTRTSGLKQHSLNPVKTSDGPTDVRGDGIFNAPSSIVIPNPTCLASTFDTELVEKIAGAMAVEARHKTVDILLAPTLNLHRDPRGGRNQESYGEDPVLAGKCGAAYIKGLQSHKVAACAKHLVCNDSETERRYYDVQVGEKTLREVYLRPFEIVAKEANPKSIMTAYNKINGTSAAQNKHIMDIVRDEWHWKGLFMSDWFGTYDGVASIRAGLDLEMPFPAARGPHLLKALAQGTLKEHELDAPALQMIRFLQDISPPTDAVRGPDRPSLRRQEDVKLNRQTAAEGAVLLRNNGSLLPLDPRTKEPIAVIGSLATDRVLTHLICPSYLVTPLEGIQSTLTQQVPLYALGLQTHKVAPKLDKRYSANGITFRKWNKGTLGTHGAEPVCVNVFDEALDAVVGARPPGLEEVFESEMLATVRVPKSGPFVLSLIAAYTADVFIDGQLVFQYNPDGLVDIQRFLFHSHQIAKTFKHVFTAGRDYQIRVVTQSQPQSGPEPVAQGTIFGMVEDLTREETLAEAVQVAQRANTVVLLVGTTSEWEMEGVDRDDITLPCGQDELIRAVVKANPRTIVVNQSGAAVDLSSAVDAPTIVHAHFGGQESGNAIADILFGKVNPSGKTSFTWPRSLQDVPSYANFPCAQDLSLKYAEETNFGYKGYQSAGIKTAFPFGYGLSYTTFSWSPAVLGEYDDNTVTLSVTVTNNGPLAGRDVVQVYVSFPDATVRTLEGFAKTQSLEPECSEIVTITLNARSFSSWDVEQGSWQLSKGEYGLHIARSVEDIAETLPFQAILN